MPWLYQDYRIERHPFTTTATISCWYIYMYVYLCDNNLKKGILVLLQRSILMVTESQSKIRLVLCILTYLTTCIFTLFICTYFYSWRSRAKKKRANFHFETESKRESMGSLFPCVCRHSRQKRNNTSGIFLLSGRENSFLLFYVYHVYV